MPETVSQSLVYHDQRSLWEAKPKHPCSREVLYLYTTCNIQFSKCKEGAGNATVMGLIPRECVN